MSAAYAELETRDYRQRPNLVINTVLVHPNAVDIMQEAIEVLLQAPMIAATRPVIGADETPEAVTGEGDNP